jgi:hypothetical protein
MVRVLSVTASLDRAHEEAADEVSLEGEEHQGGGNGGDQGGGSGQVPATIFGSLGTAVKIIRL